MRPNWHKSTYSTAAENCVEVAEGAQALVRDTQNRELGYLSVLAPEWATLLAAVRIQ